MVNTNLKGIQVQEAAWPRKLERGCGYICDQPSFTLTGLDIITDSKRVCQRACCTKTTGMDVLFDIQEDRPPRSSNCVAHASIQHCTGIARTRELLAARAAVIFEIVLPRNPSSAQLISPSLY